MKKEERLLRAIGEMDDALIVSGETAPKKEKRHGWRKWGALAACLGLILLGAWRFAPRTGTPDIEPPAEPETVTEDHMEVMELRAELPTEWDAWEVWEQSRSIQRDMDSFYQQSIPAVLQSEGEENRVYSPVNVYIALAVLTETADGETREQLLNLLDAPNMTALRERVSALWTANYQDFPEHKSILANSLWMNETVDYREETLQTLARDYFASSFAGKMGTPEMDQALQNWTNESTGHLLEDAVSDMRTNPDTVLEIVSAIYFKDAWEWKFYEDDTREETFYGASGDTQCDMMHQWYGANYYWGEGFTASRLYLRGGERMYFFLPDEGVSLNDVLQSEAVMQILRESEPGEYPNQREMMVHFSVPKFDLSSKIDLIEILKQLGVTDAFDWKKADFSNLAELENNIYVSKAEHAATVSIDEDGVTGAAYTEVEARAAADEPKEFGEIEFTLDRPFYYVITGSDGSILFAGTVWNLP